MDVLILDDEDAKSIAKAFVDPAEIAEHFSQNEGTRIDVGAINGTFNVTQATDLESARKALAKKWPDLIVLDAVFPDAPPQSKFEVISFRADRFLDSLDKACVSNGRPRPDVVLVSAQTETAKKFSQIADWLSSGRIRDLLPKSTADIGWHVFHTILRLRAERYRRERELRNTIDNADDAFRSLEAHGIISRAPQMVRVWEQIAKAARRGSNVFIQGESGTGKELVARAIAELRGKGIKTTIATIQADVADGDFFGSVRGGFTGAENKPGLIEDAKDGVLFIDEICSGGFEIQSKLLRVLDADNADFRRVGDTTTKKPKCQFVFADLMTLEKAVVQEKLRPDFRARMAIEIEVPPLRERKGDIRLLTMRFVKAFANKYKKTIEFAESVFDVFEQGQWPGNVRQLRGIIDNIVEELAGTVTLEDARRVGGQQLANELGNSINLTAVGKMKTCSVPSDVDDLLVQLSTELQYSDPCTWRGMTAKGSSTEQEVDFENSVIEALQKKLPRSIVDSVVQGLSSRKNNSPKQLHCLKALLYLVLNTNHDATVENLQLFLDLGEVQARNSVEALISLPLTSAIVRLDDSKNTYRYVLVDSICSGLAPESNRQDER